MAHACREPVEIRVATIHVYNLSESRESESCALMSYDLLETRCIHCDRRGRVRGKPTRTAAKSGAAAALALNTRVVSFQVGPGEAPTAWLAVSALKRIDADGRIARRNWASPRQGSIPAKACVKLVVNRSTPNCLQSVHIGREASGDVDLVEEQTTKPPS
jgi:hypothetical protein